MNSTAHIRFWFGISLCMVALWSCGGTQHDGAYPFEENPPFTLGQAAFQEWVAGTPEGGSGIRVFIPVTKLKAEVRFRNIYFRKQVVNIKQKPNDPDLYVGHFKTEMQHDIIMDSDPLKEARNTPPKVFPFDLEDNESVLSYEYGGEIFYIMLHNMEQKPLLAYPSGPPGDKG